MSSTKVLQKSIKREERKKKKSVKKWQERAKTVVDEKAERQERRKFNIQVSGPCLLHTDRVVLND